MEASTENLSESEDEDQDQPETSGDMYEDAVDEAARVPEGTEPAEVLGQTTQEIATEWFMGWTPDRAATKSFELNVGKMTDDGTGEWEDFFIPWTVAAISRERIRQIRKAAQSKKPSRRAQAQGQGAEEDDLKANEMIAAEGTVIPDLREAAQHEGVANPAVLLKQKMAHKPGLIDQIAGEVLSASGYDDTDVREVTAAKN